MKRENGLTLVELLITLAVVAVIIAIGMPGLNKYAENNRSTAQVNLVSGTLSLARSEAIKRGLNVVVCSSNTTTTNTPKCSGNTTWQSGWLVFADLDNNGVYDTSKANDALLAVNNGLNGGLTMYTTNFANTNKVTFRANGSLVDGGSPDSGTFVICPADKNTAHARAINITPVGAVNLAPTNSSHIPLDITNTAVTCP